MLKRAATFSLILFGVHYVSAQYKCSLPLEAENGNGGRKQPRSEASGGVAVTLYKDEEIDLRLHLGDTKTPAICYYSVSPIPMTGRLTLSMYQSMGLYCGHLIQQKNSMAVTTGTYFMRQM